MKIAIIGVGAMGSVYAALLGSAGHEVWAVDQWKEHTTLSEKGLRVEGASGDRTVRIATTDQRTSATLTSLSSPPKITVSLTRPARLSRWRRRMPQF